MGYQGWMSVNFRSWFCDVGTLVLRLFGRLDERVLVMRLGELIFYTYRYRVQSGSAIVGLNRSFGSHFSTRLDVRYCRQSKCYLQANLQNGFSLLSSYFPIHLISSTTSSYESVSKQIFSPLPSSFQPQFISSKSTALNYHSPSLSSPTFPHTLSTPLSTNENRQ